MELLQYGLDGIRHRQTKMGGILQQGSTSTRSMR